MARRQRKTRITSWAGAIAATALASVAAAVGHSALSVSGDGAAADDKRAARPGMGAAFEARRIPPRLGQDLLETGEETRPRFVRRAASIDKFDNGRFFETRGPLSPSPYGACELAGGGTYAGPGTALNRYAASTECLEPVSASDFFRADAAARVAAVAERRFAFLDLADGQVGMGGEGGGEDEAADILSQLTSMGGVPLVVAALSDGPSEPTTARFSTIAASEVPLPAAGWIFLASLAGLGRLTAQKRRRG